MINAYITTAFLRGLIEGKSLGSFEDRSKGRTGRINYQFRQGARAYNRKKRLNVEAAKKKFKQAQEKTRKKMQGLLNKWKGQKLASRKRFRANFRKAISELYYDAFSLGAGSVDTVGAFRPVRPTDKEKLWIQSAVREESEHLDKLVSDVFAGQKSLGVLQRRVDAYIESSEGMLTAAQIAGGPTDLLLHWILEGGGKGDSKTCPDCKKLHRNSPYTPQTLPTLPKQGLTRCLNKCRCRIRTVKAKPGELKRREKKDVKKLIKTIEQARKRKLKRY